MHNYSEYKRQWYLKKKERLSKLCPSCGKKIVWNSKRCGSCGAKQRIKDIPQSIPPSQKNKRHFYMDGKGNPNWKDGSYKIISRLRNCPEYHEWRDKIFKRDKFTCQECGQVGGRLQADHFPELFSDLFRELKITSYEMGRFCKKLWKAKGRTLCLKCHRLKDRKFYGNQYKKTK